MNKTSKQYLNRIIMATVFVAFAAIVAGKLFATEYVITVKSKGCATDGGTCGLNLHTDNGEEVNVTGVISSPGDYKYCTAGYPGTVGCCRFTTADQNCTYTCSGEFPDGTAWSQVITYVQGKTPTIKTGADCN